MTAKLSEIEELIKQADKLISDADEMLKDNKSMQSDVARWHVDNECYKRDQLYAKDNIF